MRKSRFLPVLAWLILVLFSAGLRAQTAAEPSVHQIYEAAGKGDIRGAREMIDQVIARHPGSAKAHYVKAELAARDRDAGTAKTEMQAAEKLAPGLPFVKAEAVTALRTEIGRMAAPSAPAPSQRATAPPERAPPASGSSALPIAWILIAGVVGIGIFLLMRRRREPAFQPPPPTSYARDDAFGRAPGWDAGSAQPGMGSSIARGLGTGLAVGAGVVVAQEIGRRMFEHGREGNNAYDAGASHHANDSNSQIARDAGLGAMGPSSNQDMGGQDFGIAGDGGWDDAGSVDDGGGDWDR
jgi:hypothetical protein